MSSAVNFTKSAKRKGFTFEITTVDAGMGKGFWRVYRNFGISELSDKVDYIDIQ